MVFDFGRPGLPQSDPTLLRLRLLGRMEARSLVGENVLPVGGKTRGLLAVLALADRQAVSRTSLAELLWSRRPDDLARASLRQEIHRLLDALSPLGVDVIDVQRHTLALRPALSSVDVERLYSSGMPVLDEIGTPLPPLLGDLNGIDPALDVWLEDQRGRLARHVEGLLTSAILDYTDPVAKRAAADQLLLLDECNEVAWRGRIDASLALGEDAQALRHAEEVVRLFERLTNRTPGPQTMRLVEVVRARGATGGDGASTLLDVSSPGGQYGSVAHYPAMKDAARYLGTLNILPVRLPTGGAQTDLTPIAEMIEDCFAQVLPAHLLSVAVKSMPACEGVDQSSLLMRAGQTGADFALSSVLRVSPAGEDGVEESRLVLRLLDVRHDAPVIAWATSVPLPTLKHASLTADYLAAIRVNLVNFARVLLWTIALYEGRRVSHRSVREQGAIGRSLRALILLTRCDVQMAGEIQDLLYGDEKSDSGLQLRFLVRASFEIVRENFFLLGEAGVRREIAEKAAQQYHAERPESDLAMLLLGILAMMTPGQMERAALLTKALRAKVLDGMVPDSAQLVMLEAAISLWRAEGDDRAHVHLDRYEHIRDETLISGLTDATAALFAFLTGRREAAERAIRLLTTLYPRHPLGLVYQLAIESAREAHDACGRTLFQINAVLPDLSVDRVLAAHPFLREEHLAVLGELLRAAGMPDEPTALATLGVPGVARYVG